MQFWRTDYIPGNLRPSLPDRFRPFTCPIRFRRVRTRPWIAGRNPVMTRLSWAFSQN